MVVKNIRTVRVNGSVLMRKAESALNKMLFGIDQARKGCAQSAPSTE